jgi:hypothetical protein
MRSLTFLSALCIVVFSQTTFAATPFEVLVRVNGPVRVAANETTPSIIVVNGNALIDGQVLGTVVVVQGRAEIIGVVHGDVIAFGDVYLAPQSRVTRNITIYGGALSRGEAARVDGQIFFEEAPAFVPPSASFLFLSIALFAIGGTLLLTLTAWRPLTNSAELVSAHPLNMLAIGSVVALGVPLAAIAILPTGVGVVLGLAILVCAIPAAIFSGFTVAAMAVGNWIGTREPHLIPVVAHRRALAEVVIGTMALLIVLLLPVVGIVLLLVVSTMGVGALVFKAWSAWPHQRRRAIAA